jgi:serine/threonine-protein kinase
VVAISVSAGPPVLVPDVTQRKEAEAVDKLKGSGFTPRVQQEATANPSEDGVVLDQDPAGGAQAARGSTVTIVVGRYQP